MSEETERQKSLQRGWHCSCVEKFYEKIGEPLKINFSDDLYPETAQRRVRFLDEELQELVEAFDIGHEVRILDALADILYIVAGTAAIFDLPLEAAFNEVHLSNMTKNKNARLKVDDKGKDENYKEPDLRKILTDYRRLGHGNKTA